MSSAQALHLHHMSVVVEAHDAARVVLRSGAQTADMAIDLVNVLNLEVVHVEAAEDGGGATEARKDLF